MTSLRLRGLQFSNGCARPPKPERILGSLHDQGIPLPLPEIGHYGGQFALIICEGLGSGGGSALGAA